MFLISVSVTFHILYVQIILVRSIGLNDHFWERDAQSVDICNVLFVFCLFVILLISRFNFEGWICVLIVPLLTFNVCKNINFEKCSRYIFLTDTAGAPYNQMVI